MWTIIGILLGLVVGFVIGAIAMYAYVQNDLPNNRKP